MVKVDRSLGAANGTLGECRHCSADLIYCADVDRWEDWHRHAILRGGKVISQSRQHCAASVFSGLHEPYLDFEAK